MMTCDFITATVHDDALLKTIDHMCAQLHGSRAHSKLSLNVMTQAKMEQRRSVTRTYYFRSKAFPTSAQRWMFWTNNGCLLPVGHNPPSVCPTWENKTPHPSIFAQAVDCHACWNGGRDNPSGGQVWSLHISEYEGMCGECMETKTEHIKRLPVRSQVTTLHAALILCHTYI